MFQSGRRLSGFEISMLNNSFCLQNPSLRWGGFVVNLLKLNNISDGVGLSSRQIATSFIQRRSWQLTLVYTQLYMPCISHSANISKLYLTFRILEIGVGISHCRFGTDVTVFEDVRLRRFAFKIVPLRFGQGHPRDAQ